MKNQGLKFNENEINNLNNLDELLTKVFNIVIKSIDNIPENKKGKYLMLIEKIKYVAKNLFQENYTEIITGKLSITLGFHFISVISIFKNICSNLEKIMVILKQEKVTFKNKSFEQRNYYEILVINHINSLQSSKSTTRNRLSSENESIKNVFTTDKINKSMY